MNHCAQYVARLKVKLGNPGMSDRELGEHLGFIQSNIARAKGGYMTDPLAIAIARELGEDPAEVVIVARAEREKDLELREGMLAIVGKVLALTPARAAPAEPAGGVRVPTHNSGGKPWRKRSQTLPPITTNRPAPLRAFFIRLRPRGERGRSRV